MHGDTLYVWLYGQPTDTDTDTDTDTGTWSLVGELHPLNLNTFFSSLHMSPLKKKGYSPSIRAMAAVANLSSFILCFPDSELERERTVFDENDVVLPL